MSSEINLCILTMHYIYCRFISVPQNKCELNTGIPAFGRFIVFVMPLLEVKGGIIGVVAVRKQQDSPEKLSIPVAAHN